MTENYKVYTACIESRTIVIDRYVLKGSLTDLRHVILNGAVFQAE